MAPFFPNLVPPAERPNESIYGSSQVYDRLVTFEGGEGSGKSTVHQYLRGELPHGTVFSREPGGTPVGQQVRKILLNPENAIPPLTEILLFLSDRADHVQWLVKPQLAEKNVVVLDRFAASTDAYQLHARGGYRFFPMAQAAHEVFDVRPGRTYLFDGDPRVFHERISSRWTKPDTSEVSALESRIDNEHLAFHDKVREGFLLHAQQHPEVVVVDAEQPLEVVAETVLSDLRRYLGGLKD